ncbi:MAG: hypothetical protein MUC66_04575 [Methanolinea sp.]|jgi:hypothetical protein|nr:hypothetical protein [Methanolinea sp.]
MSGPKTLTIGITVNLEHYENLRLEVNGEVQSQDDARDLARFLYDVMGTYGRGDPATMERIENFRRRVLPVPDGTGETGSTAFHQATTPPVPTGTGASGSSLPGPGAEGPAPVLQPHLSPAAEIPELKEQRGAGGVATCEDCGTPVNQAEQKMSMLFTSRVLCRKCLKKV